MVEFQTNIISKAPDEIIGCEVTIISESGDTIEKIHITDEKGIQELAEKINNLEGNCVTTENLATILKNVNNTDFINAGKLDGKHSDYFAPRNHTHENLYLDNNHALKRANKDTYAHVRLIDNLSTNNYQDGEALSARQGKVLDDKINDITPTIEKKMLHSKFELIKNGVVVTLNINGYKFGEVAADGNYHGLLDIPAPFKPVKGSLPYLYIPNVHDTANPRMRVNTDTSQIDYMFNVGQISKGKQFDGCLTYVCDPSRQ